MGLSFLEGIDAKAFAAGHGEVGESFVGAISLAVMMREGLGHFDQTVAAAAFDFLGDPKMQRGARPR